MLDYDRSKLSNACPPKKNQAKIYNITLCAPCNNADGAKQLMVGLIFLSTLHHIIDPFTVDL